MKKLFVVLFSSSLIGISFFNLSKSLFFLPVLVNLSTPYTVMRIILVVVLISYAFIPRFRLHLTKSLLGNSGLLLIALGIFTIFSPGLMGHLNDWVLLGDSIILIEAGILAVILTAELSFKPPKFLIGAIYLTRSLYEKISKKFVYAFMVIESKAHFITQVKRTFDPNKITDLLNNLAAIYEVPNKAPP